VSSLVFPDMHTFLQSAAVQSVKVTTLVRSVAKEPCFVAMSAIRSATETLLVHPARINAAIDAYTLNVKRSAAQS